MKICKNEKVLISACLAGVNCKYDGKNNFNEKIIKIIKEHDVILVCPEQMGGLKTPRCPAEICGNCVKTKRGKDVTKEYEKGAAEVLDIAKRFNIKKAILKSRSPSCGKNQIYDGTFGHKLKMGSGVTAKLLMENGMEVISSDEI